jgi:hypothetical protein
VEGLPSRAAGRGWAPAQRRPAAATGHRGAPAIAPGRQTASSIEKIPGPEWNRCLGGRGSFTWEGLHFLERTFAGNPEPENDWRFHYYRVLAADGRLRLATFFTDALWKADMLAPASVSRQIERLRGKDAHYLVSRTFGMGSLLTEGNHLFLDPEARSAGSSEWQDLMALLLEAVGEDAEARGAETIMLRDLPDGDSEMDALLLEHGFSKLPAPDSMVVETAGWDEDEFLRAGTRDLRRHHARHVRPWNDSYAVEVLGAHSRRPTLEELDHFHELYENVQRRSFALNTFPLPRDLFARMLEFPAWELLSLRFRPGTGRGVPDAPVAVVACFVGDDRYVPLVVGLDYRYVRSHGLYRQCLRHVLLRARALGRRRVLFGMGASLEKRRFGARPEPRIYYVRADDHYSFDVIQQISVES